jgi:DNA-binding XRE family transcriptional regulator
MTKNVFKQTIEKFSGIFDEVKKILKQDVVYGTRLGKIKIKELKLEQKKLEKLIEIGRKTYFLYKKGLIDNQELKQLCNQLAILESQAKVYHTTAEEYKKKIKL